MTSILIALLVFLFSFILQITVVRFLRLFHINAFFSFAIYGLGVVVLYIIVNQQDLFYTSILIYTLFTTLLVSFSFVPLLGGRSPSSVIMTMLSKENKITITQLLQAFHDNDLIRKRLDDLVDARFVQKQGSRYIISQRGLFIYQMIEVLRNITGLKDQG